MPVSLSTRRASSGAASLANSLSLLGLGGSGGNPAEQTLDQLHGDQALDRVEGKHDQLDDLASFDREVLLRRLRLGCLGVLEIVLGLLQAVALRLVAR